MFLVFHKKRVIALKCKKVGHPHWRCDEENQNSASSSRNKAKPTNRFEILDSDDSDSDIDADTTTKVDLNNLSILKVMRYSSKPWGEF